MSDTTVTPAEAPAQDGALLTAQQYAALAAPLGANRIREHDDGRPWIEGADVRRWLTRIFGYGGWSDKTVDKQVLGQEQVIVDATDEQRIDPTTGEERDKITVWRVTREVTVRLVVRTADGRFLAQHDGTAAVTVDHPVLGQAHNDASNTAETYALKRAAANLGDQFGLGLRAGVLAAAYVAGSLVRPAGTEPPGEVQAEPDSPPSERDDLPAAPLTAAEATRRMADAAARARVTVRPMGYLTAALQASIARAGAAARADTESSVPVTS